jgi:hypothetical protein
MAATTGAAIELGPRKVPGQRRVTPRPAKASSHREAAAADPRPAGAGEVVAAAAARRRSSAPRVIAAAGGTRAPSRAVARAYTWAGIRECPFADFREQPRRTGWQDQGSEQVALLAVEHHEFY